eukprot:5484885-Prymnesium_polylepis.1
MDLDDPLGAFRPRALGTAHPLGPAPLLPCAQRLAPPPSATPSPCAAPPPHAAPRASAEGGPCYQLYTTEFYQMIKAKLNPGKRRHPLCASTRGTAHGRAGAAMRVACYARPRETPRRVHTPPAAPLHRRSPSPPFTPRRPSHPWPPGLFARAQAVSLSRSRARRA